MKALLASVASIAVAGCATTRPAMRPADTAACPCVYEVHPYYVNFIPFGAGQFQNRQRGKGLAFFIAEATTGAASAGIWLYLTNKYDQSVPIDDADRARTLQRIEIGTGLAFLGLAAWGIVDALLHYEHLVKR